MTSEFQRVITMDSVFPLENPGLLGGFSNNTLGFPVSRMFIPDVL